MRRVADYRIVASRDGLEVLASKVNDHIKRGYKPVGGIAIDNDGYFYQAVVLEEE